MRKTVIRSIALAALGFVLLFGARLGLGYLEHPEGVDRADQVDNNNDSGGGFENEKHNYASQKVASRTQGAAIDQKYERVADLRAQTRAFDADETAIRAATAQQAGVIQLEHKQGLAGGRVLQLAVGVTPERFDAYVDAIRAIGKGAHLTVDKQDRTNSFKELAAKRAVLEATRDALVALKAHSGSIQEMVALEDRILDVHQQIQSLGISLGEFDEVNELCTVKITLTEAREVAAGPTIPFARRVRIAFEWAVPFYLRLLGILLTAVLIALAGVVAFERVRQLQAKARPATATVVGDEPHG
ncbi:MAG: DUF4349 domain-containing protein [Deltaproteobacteria bacterium]|nr:DUF4349 domain-containing protein [Deltaproteobacteria bacterium]